MINANTMEDIFYSDPSKGGARGSIGSYQTIADWIDKGYMEVRQGVYSQFPIPGKGQDPIWDLINNGKKTESIEHKKLKYWAVKFLESGGFNVTVELQHAYTFIDRAVISKNDQQYISEINKSGICDVWALKGNNGVIVECGNTPPIKALWAFYQSTNVETFIQMPFTVSNGTNSIIAKEALYMFKLTGKIKTNELLHNEMVDYITKDYWRNTGFIEY